MYNALAAVYIMEALHEAKENEIFEELCSELSPEDANTARKSREAKKQEAQKEREAHRKNLQIAEASRPKIVINNYNYPWL